VEFGMETVHNHTYTFSMKSRLQVKNYKHGDGAKLRGYVSQI